MPSERRLAFGGIAELYDQARPSYPSALVDDVLEFAAAREGDRAVEVGAGTGKATVLFAQRGLDVLALEPSAEMAEVARRNLTSYPRVAVEQTEFEQWRPDRRGKLVYSAQAWHWIAPEVRYLRAREALTDEGALAVFWNRLRWESCSLQGELAGVYARLAPDLGPGAGPGPMHPAVGLPRAWWQDWIAELGAAPGFTGSQARSYSWNQAYSADDYRQLLRTHSDHILLEDDRREALLDAVAGVIERHGGVLDLEYECSLAMARSARGYAAEAG